MTQNYRRIDPYIIPYLQAGKHYELIIYHIESQQWFDNTNQDFILQTISSNKIVRPGDIVFDLGCNSGSITVVLADLVGQNGQIHAFDPYPWNAAATKANAALNYHSNVVTYPIGLSNRDYRIKVSPNDSRIYAEAADDGCQELVIESINSYMYLEPSFLKIDIEGAEHDLFEGQQPQTFASVRGFALEFHPFWIRPRGIDPRTSLRGIEGAGFSLHYHSPSYAPYAIDDYDDSHHIFWGERRLQAAELAAPSLHLVPNATAAA